MHALANALVLLQLSRIATADDSLLRRAVEKISKGPLTITPVSSSPMYDEQAAEHWRELIRILEGP